MRVTRALALSTALVGAAYLARIASLQTAAMPAYPVVIDRYFGELLLGILITTALLAVLVLAKPGQGPLSFCGSVLHNWMLVIGSFLSIVGVAIAIVPQLQMPAQTTLAIPPAPTVVTPPIRVSHPVYFANGQDGLEDSQIRTISNVFDALLTCGDAQVSVKAFASSAQFHADPENKINVKLANDRADGVRRLAVSRGLKAVQVKCWENYKEMATARGIKDVESNGHRVKIRELLNRRAEIEILLPSRCVQ